MQLSARAQSKNVTRTCKLVDKLCSCLYFYVRAATTRIISEINFAVVIRNFLFAEMLRENVIILCRINYSSANNFLKKHYTLFLICIIIEYSVQRSNVEFH